jgi:hypothetical protein
MSRRTGPALSPRGERCPSVEIEEVPGRHRGELTSFGTDVDRVDVDITFLHPVHEITWAKPNGTGCLVIRRCDDPIAWVIEFKPAFLRPSDPFRVRVGAALRSGALSDSWPPPGPQKPEPLLDHIRDVWTLRYVETNCTASIRRSEFRLECVCYRDDAIRSVGFAGVDRVATGDAFFRTSLRSFRATILGMPVPPRRNRGGSPWR